MRVTDDRYAAERSRLELALRMIGHEARTCTIKSCTGLSDDRIRRLYATYFKAPGCAPVRRKRGKSPTRTTIYVKNCMHQCEATTLAILFSSYELIQISPRNRVARVTAPATVEFGQRFCGAYEKYRTFHPAAHICFERAWTLLSALTGGEELDLAICRECDSVYLYHLLEIDDRRCPCCKLKGVRPGSRRRLSPRKARRPALQRPPAARR